MWNSTSGLCGRHNGDPYDDFRDGDNDVDDVSALGAAWRRGTGCAGAAPQRLVNPCDAGGEADELGRAATEFCRRILNSPALDNCRKVVLVINDRIFYVCVTPKVTL